MKGGAPRVVWHTSESNPHHVSARSAAQALEQQRTSAHLVWNPQTGDIVQMLPATLAAGLLNAEVGREGRASIQILVIGLAGEPFTNGPLTGLERIMCWLDMWRVPRRWPAGRPLPSPQAYGTNCDRRLWARGGHFGCSQVPQATGPAPGAIDIYKITEPERPVGLPLPRTAFGDEPPVPDTEELLTRRLRTPDGMHPVGAAAPAEVTTRS